MDHRFGVHADGLVDHQQFAGRYLLPQNLEQLVGKFHIVDAVAAVPGEINGREVCVVFAQCVDHLVTLGTQTIVIDQLLEAAPYGDVMDRAGHGQGVQPQLRLHPVVPRQDGTVERCVVAQDGCVAEVDGLEEGCDQRLGYPLGRAVVLLDPHHDRLEHG